MSGSTVKIVSTYRPHECGMCGPSSMGTHRIVIADRGIDETFRQAICDNSDPIDAEYSLTRALELLGFKVEISEDWGEQ